MNSSVYSLSSQVSEWLRQNINFNKSLDYIVPCDGLSVETIWTISNRKRGFATKTGRTFGTSYVKALDNMHKGEEQ